MTQSLFGIYGASGCGRGVAPLLRHQLKKCFDSKLVFIDDSPVTKLINGIEIWSYDQFLSADVEKKR